MRSHSRRFYKIMNVEFNTGGTNFIPVLQASARPTQSAPATTTPGARAKAKPATALVKPPTAKANTPAAN